MEVKHPNRRRRLESVIQKKIKEALEIRGWTVMVTHGNMYQKGFPDLYAYQRSFGSRWIEVKCPENPTFTPAQLEYFHKMASAGVGVWVLLSEEQDELDLLFKRPNWHHYLSIMKI